MKKKENSIDLRSPYVVSVSDVVSGSPKQLDLRLPVPEECGVGLIGIPSGSDIDVTVSMQSVSEGIFVQGQISATAVGNCARCATEFTKHMNEPMAELVFWPERREALASEGDDEIEDMPIIEDMHIDLEPIIRDAIVLALPFTPLCAPDCEGLCQECGEPWKDLPADHRHEFLNPAFSALDALAEQMRNN
ncbi:YceD family protein [Arcanobacterium phocae]|uniref:DUF177 domain-containing protein n=1 Tax=Arcanobacterium phocae TaxID=131112 RepID=A0A1H2LH86_9ACTO|nr:DUF177 domain-containing protein [Arcanobacterium phocae]SDU80279.1 uncharacterized protein SAMN04489737_1154 [Arcanobacterium phocae]